MAVVYRAMDLRLHRPVAIKVLPPDVAFNGDVRTRFIREAQTAAQLNHPNIVPIYSVDDTDDGALTYFVMAFVDGESLGVRLAREGAWPVDRTVRVLRDVADALAYAHARGVVHRDIKPDNILIDRASGRPLVTDFGIARAAAGETRLTVTGVAVGTPAYMSPEQALGERELDGRSDLYSLAVVGYHMLSGDTPFKAGEHAGDAREARVGTAAPVARAASGSAGRILASRSIARWPSGRKIAGPTRRSFATPWTARFPRRTAGRCPRFNFPPFSRPRRLRTNRRRRRSASRSPNASNCRRHKRFPPRRPASAAESSSAGIERSAAGPPLAGTSLRHRAADSDTATTTGRSKTASSRFGAAW